MINLNEKISFSLGELLSWGAGLIGVLATAGIFVGDFHHHYFKEDDADHRQNPVETRLKKLENDVQSIGGEIEKSIKTLSQAGINQAATDSVAIMNLALCATWINNLKTAYAENDSLASTELLAVQALMARAYHLLQTFAHGETVKEENDIPFHCLLKELKPILLEIASSLFEIGEYGAAYKFANFGAKHLHISDRDWQQQMHDMAQKALYEIRQRNISKDEKYLMLGYIEVDVEQEKLALNEGR